MKIFSRLFSKNNTQDLSYGDTVQTWLNGNSKKAKFTKETLEKRNIPICQLSPSSLPDHMNDVRFDGAKVVGGKFCNTVGEYKDACDKFYK